jgi:hypothetical protein
VKAVSFFLVHLYIESQEGFVSITQIKFNSSTRFDGNIFIIKKKKKKLKICMYMRGRAPK